LDRQSHSAYFDPDLGRLISVNFTATLNSSLVGKAENVAGSAVLNAYMIVGTDMYVAMINGQHLPLNTLLRVPKTGGTYVSAFDGAEDYGSCPCFTEIFLYYLSL
jgi:hypothetical protein